MSIVGSNIGGIVGGVVGASAGVGVVIVAIIVVACLIGEIDSCKPSKVTMYYIICCFYSSKVQALQAK